MRTPRHIPPVTPVDPEEAARLRAKAEEMRAQAKVDRERRIRERRELLSALDHAHLARIGIHDIDAAAACPSAAHPSPGSPGAPTCPCQRPEGERQQGVESLLEALQAHSGELEQAHMAEQEALGRAAEQLGVTIEEAGGLAPYQILGRVDGVRFYLRERHGEWTLQIPDETAGPDGDPCGITAGTYLIAGGTEDDLYDRDDRAKPLKVAVEAVRTHLARAACEHRDAIAYCPHCGQRMPG